jgi:hypothetical protein
MNNTLRFTVLFGLLLLSQICSAQKKKATIPFQLTAFNNIVVKVMLNEKDTVQLMMHTAASDVTLTELAVKKLSSICFDKSIEGIKSWGGEAGEARVSENNTLGIAGLKWDSITITENKNSGQFTDGKFGLDLFNNKYVCVDFNKQIITVSDKLPKRLKGYSKYKIVTENGFMFIEAVCELNKDSAFTNRFLIHSGYAGSILLDDKFVNDHQLSQKLKIIGEKELKDSYGNYIKTQKAILPFFKIGKQTLADIPVGFFSGAMGNQKISIVGGDVLKRFNWVIDAERSFIYLKPNTNYDLPYAKV